MKIANLEIKRLYGGKFEIITTVDSLPIEDMEKAIQGIKEGKKYDLDIKEDKGKRTMDANAYMWVLLDKLAKKLSTTKHELYIEFVKRVGCSEIVPIKDVALTEYIRKWNSIGLGWFCEVMRESKFEGFTTVMCYYGTSVYNSVDMWRLTNEIIDECKPLGIETKTPKELESLMERWETK